MMHPQRGGNSLTDQHGVFRFEDRRAALSGFAWLVENDDPKSMPGPEAALDFYFSSARVNVHPLPRVMFAVRRSSDDGRWIWSLKPPQWLMEKQSSTLGGLGTNLSFMARCYPSLNVKYLTDMAHAMRCGVGDKLTCPARKRAPSSDCRYQHPMHGPACRPAKLHSAVLPEAIPP